MKEISIAERMQISLRLQAVNPLFRAMWWAWCPMKFSKKTETVQLETEQTRDGGTNFRIVANPKYWESRSELMKIFIVCHEMCHVMFCHFIVHPKLDSDWVNVAQDIQVNEYLLRNYFEKEEIDCDDIATVKSVFKHKSDDVLRREGYMYYYNLLMQCLR